MPPFRKVLLLYNPTAGRGSSRNRRALLSAAEIFRAAGVDVELEATRATGEGGVQAREAIGRGFDAIFACGGDGTVYDVLQGMVHAPEGVSLGILPLGTANVLAKDVGLPDGAVAAARAALSCVPRRIAAGEIRWFDPRQNRECARFFSVAAGLGVHAELIYKSTAQIKRHGGFAAYYLAGFALLFSHRFVPFAIEITLPDGRLRSEEVLEVVGMRVGSFGKWLNRWRPGGALRHDYLQLVTLKSCSRWSMVRYALSAIFRGAEEASHSRSASIEFIRAISVRCSPIQANSPRGIRAQADGEALQAMPVMISIVPQALTLLMPPAPL